MKPKYTQTGGGFASDSPLTHITGVQKIPPGATWPLVKLALFNDHIELKIMSNVYSVALSDIDSVHRVVAIPIFGDGVSIVHRGQAPKIMVFWSLFRQKRLLENFSDLGIQIGATEHGDPTKKLNRSQNILIVFIALIILFSIAYKIFLRI